MGDNHGFAGGNQIELVTLVPTVSWRPFRAIGPKFDYVDLATGAGMYSFSSGEDPGAFDSFSGWILEPIRFDFSFSASAHEQGPLVGTLGNSGVFHYGLAIIPAGFEHGAFGIKDGGPSPRIPAEWLQNIGIFVDVSSVFYGMKHRGEKPPYSSEH